MAKQLVFDYRGTDLTAPQLAFCDFAVKLTLTPGETNADDIQALRTAGYDDEQISLGTQVISYFNYINRIAEGLGVDDEPWMDISHEEWRQRKSNFR